MINKYTIAFSDTFRDALKNGMIVELRSIMSSDQDTMVDALRRNNLPIDNIKPEELQNMVINDICNMIVEDEGQQYYEDCKYGPWHTKAALARQGFFRDELIIDAHFLVRERVYKHDPSYISYVVNTSNEYEFHQIAGIFRKQPIVNFNDLERFLQNPKCSTLSKNDRKALEAKLATQNIFVSTMDATMNPWDLFRANRPAWKFHVSGEHIIAIERYADGLRHAQDGQTWFENLLTGNVRLRDFQEETERMYKQHRHDVRQKEKQRIKAQKRNERKQAQQSKKVAH